MSNSTDNLKQLWNNPKSRLMMISTFGVVGVGLLVGVSSLKKDDTPDQLKTSVDIRQTAPAISNTPGKVDSLRYANSAWENNDDRYANAQKNGGTALPTPIALTSTDTSIGKQGTSIGQAPPVPPTPPSPPTPQPTAPNVQEPQKPQIQYVEVPRIPPHDASKQLERIASVSSPTLLNMETDYRGPANQALNVAQNSQPMVSQGNIAQNNSNDTAARTATPAANKNVVILAGTMYPARLITSINTDEEGPIMAEIIQGPFNKARLLGSLKNNNGKNEKVVVVFDKITIPKENKTYAINAFAINYNTSRPGLSSDTDHHYMLTYGSIFAAALLQGYGTAVAQSGATTTTNVLGGTTTTYPDKTNEQIWKIAAGQVGTSMGQAVARNAFPPTTVTVNSGETIGILFMNDLTN